MQIKSIYLYYSHRHKKNPLWISLSLFLILLSLLGFSIHSAYAFSPAIQIQNPPSSDNYNYLDAQAQVDPKPSAYHPEFGDDDYANSYYGRVDPHGERTTLHAWKDVNGFHDATAEEIISAQYINAFDLGFGRKMSCLNKERTDKDEITISRPCYVDNYLDPTIKGDTNFAATVTMERITQPDGKTFVAFFVYDPQGKRINQIELDSEGAKSVPESCYACHGGRNDVNGNPVGGHYLPWDIELLENWSGQKRIDEQSEAFRELNLIAFNDANHTNKTNIQTLITSWYDGAPDIGTTFNTWLYKQNGYGIIPRDESKKNWFTDPVGHSRGLRNDNVVIRYEREQSLYGDVYVKYCRACHTAQGIDWQDAVSFNQAAFKRICQADEEGHRKQSIMPNAELTDRLFTFSDSSLRAIDPRPAVQILCANMPLKPLVAPPNNDTPLVSEAKFKNKIDEITDKGNSKCTNCHKNNTQNFICSNKTKIKDNANVGQNRNVDLGGISSSMADRTLTHEQFDELNNYLNSPNVCSSAPSSDQPLVTPPLEPNPNPIPRVKPIAFTSTLVAQHSSKCLDIEGASQHDNANALQYQCHGKNNQAFIFTPVKGKELTYTLKAKHSGLCLAVDGQATEKGASVLQQTCNNGLHQQFRLGVFASVAIAPPITDAFTVHPLHSNLCVDVFGGSTDNRADVIQWECHGGQNQKWEISGFKQ